MEPAPDLTVLVTAEGFRDESAELSVEAGGTAEASVSLERALPGGQIRGVVQGFSGEALTYPDPQQLARGNMPGVPVDPNTGYSVQLWGAILGMLFIPLGYDHTFMEQARIFVDGSLLSEPDRAAEGFADR